MTRQVTDKETLDRETSEKIVVGRIAGVYGVKGWVKLYSYTDPMEAIVEYSPWYIRPEKRRSAPWEKIRLKAGKRHARTVVAKLEHCNDRDQAYAYIGYEVAIDAEQLEALKGKDEYYWRDLIGLQVINQQQVSLGTVKNLLETGANDVLVTVSETEDGETKERLIPWTMGMAILSVDLEQGVIQVDWDADF